MSSLPFADRMAAGEALAAHLQSWGDTRPVVLALPRGGVPVAAPVARVLKAPLDVLPVRKLGLPGHEEVAFGAIAPGGARVLNEEVVRLARLTPAVMAEVEAEERDELHRRVGAYREKRPFPELSGRTVLLIDDGLATGATMRVAVEALRSLAPAQIVVAVPVASPAACAALREVADEVVCLHQPHDFRAVGQFYRDFSQTSDAEVHALLTAQEVSHDR